jgi:HlyD family secretion protein
MKRLLPHFVFVSLIIVGCGKAATPDPAADDAPKPVVKVTLASVSRADLRASLSVPGTLAPLPNQEAKIAPLVAGRILKVYVKAGDTVAKGGIVATLDPGPLLGQIQQAQAVVKTSQATLNQARLNYQSQIAEQKASVEAARSNLQAQQIALQKLISGSRPQEVAQAQSAVTSAESGLQSAEQNLSRSQTLYGQGLLARKDLEAAQSEERTAKAQLDSAQASLSLSKQGNRPEDIAAGRVAVRQAEQQLKVAQQQITQNASKAQDVRIAEGQLENATGALNSAKAQLAALTIHSPLSGIVIGDTPNAGESIDTTGTIATIVNLSSVRLVLNVPSVQIAGLVPGMDVSFTAESNPKISHHAKITVIDKAVDPTTNTVKVEALALNDDRTLRDDGFVKAEIITSSHPHALVVPVDAVVDKDGKSTSFLVGSDHIAHAIEVKTGVRQGSQIEILSGLKDGDRIVSVGAFELEDGTQVETGA